MSFEKLTWYVARSGGIVAWCLLALSLLLGLLLSSRALGKRASPAWILSVHRFLGGLSVAFTAVHIIAIMMDDFVDFGLSDVLLPFAATWQPWAVAWGIVAMYLMIAIEATSLVMNRLPKRLWRWVHWTSGGLFLTATLHGFLAGTDAGRAFIGATVAMIAALATLTTVRVRRARREAVPRADPRELLEQLREKRAIRAEPPEHVLDSLTLTTRPKAHRPRRQRDPALASMHSPLNEADQFEWQPSSAATPSGQPAVAAQSDRAVAVAQRSTSTAAVADVSTQPEWDRPTPPPEPPETIEDALPEVPWSMPVPDIGGPSLSPGRWRPRDQHDKHGGSDDEEGQPFFGPTDETHQGHPPTKDPSPDPNNTNPDQTNQEHPPTNNPDPDPDQTNQEHPPTNNPDPDQTNQEHPPAASPTGGHDPRAGTMEPPKPTWSDPPEEPTRRAGPAPGVWKRQPTREDNQPPTWD